MTGRRSRSNALSIPQWKLLQVTADKIHNAQAGENDQRESPEALIAHEALIEKLWRAKAEPISQKQFRRELAQA